MRVAAVERMRNRLRLATLLPAIAGAAITAACGGSVATLGDAQDNTQSSTRTPPTKTDDEGFDLDVCTGTEYRALEGVTAGDGSPSDDGAVDYLELRDQYDQGVEGAPSTVAKAGTPCAIGPDIDQCKADLAAFRSDEGWSPYSIGMEPSRHRYLVWTVGTEVGSVTSLDALRTFVSKVENAKDAALLATASGQYRFVCDGTKNAAKTATGWKIRVQSGHTCGEGTKVEEHVMQVNADGATTITNTKLIKKGEPNCAIGRRPEGLRVAAPDSCGSADAVGRFYAEAAVLEAASVTAFERLAEELLALGASKELVESALASRDDEVRHARMTANLARRRGASPSTLTVAPIGQRTAYEIALENAVEGCVRETYGALVAHHQALAAQDPTVAAVMRTIAEDETRHAELAWDVASWLEPQLSASERAVIQRERARAIGELRDALAVELEADLIALAGMPAPTHAVTMLDELEARFVAPMLAA